MGLGAIGPGPAGTSLSRVTGAGSPAAPAPTPVTAEAAETLGDSVAALLNDLSAADIAKLMDLIGRPLPAQDTARLQDLVRTVFSATVEGDVTRALGALSQIVVLDPSRPDILRTDPAIESIRASVDQFLDRYATLARLDAEGRLEQAAQQASPSASERLTGWDMPRATMVLIANRVFDSGGLTNYVLAAELAQVVIDASRWAPGVVSLPAEPQLGRIKSEDAAKEPSGTAVWRASGRMAARLRYLWLRAPLLIMLLAWLVLGIASGFGSLLWRRFWPETWPGSLVELAFQVWGIGFLILVAFGFFARVRKVRF